jgi:hypothetical protein
MTVNPQNSLGPFLPTSFFLTNDYDQSYIRLQAILTEMALKVNKREVSIYSSIEVPTGQAWDPRNPGGIDRQTFRKVFLLSGTIAAGATQTFAHNITGATFFSKIYGTATTNVIDYRPIPYASATLITDQISLTTTSANVVIVNGATAPAITSCCVVLEYFKD